MKEPRHFHRRVQLGAIPDGISGNASKMVDAYGKSAAKPRSPQQRTALWRSSCCGLKSKRTVRQNPGRAASASCLPDDCRLALQPPQSKYSRSIRAPDVSRSRRARLFQVADRTVFYREQDGKPKNVTVRVFHHQHPYAVIIASTV